MTCRREIKKLQLEAPRVPEVDAYVRRNNPMFRDGYVWGYQDALQEALSIVEEHEEGDDGEVPTA